MEVVMKQTLNLSVGAVISEPYDCSSVSKPVASFFSHRAEQVVRLITRLHAHLPSLGAALFFAVIFIGTSYLFFYQLAAHGW